MGDSIAFDRTIQLMQDRLSLNSLNQRVISGNLANMSTPGFKAKELSFEETLKEAIGDPAPQLVRSNASHLNPMDLDKAMRTSELVETGPVDLDQEMVKLSRNNIEYQYMVTMLNKKFEMLKLAINEGGQ